MSQQIIYLGSAPDDGTGDPARTAFDKTNYNFTELYGRITSAEEDLSDIQWSDIHSIPAFGSAAYRDVGTNTGNLVEVLSGGKLPALDGSNLTNISGGGGGSDITIDGIPVAGQTAFWTASNHLEGRTLLAADISDLDAATGIPVGGSTGQILRKKTGTDYDTEWAASPTSLPTGGVSGQALIKQSGTDGDATWQTIVASGGNVVGPASSTTGRAAIFADTTGKLLGQTSAAVILEGDARLTNARTPTTHSHPFSELSGVASSAQGVKADSAIQSTTLVDTIETLAGAVSTPESDWQVIMIDPGTPDSLKRVLLTTTQYAALVQTGELARNLSDRISFLEGMSAVHKDAGFAGAGQVVTTTGITREVTSNTADDVSATVADIATANAGFIADCKVDADALVPTTLTITSGALTFDAAATTFTLVGTAIASENITISNAIWTNMLPGVPYTLYVKQPSSAVTVSWNSSGVTMKHLSSLGSYQINNALLAWVLKKVTIGATTYCTTSYFGDTA